MSVPLVVIEDIIDASGIAPPIEALLPASARGRQLTARTLLTGMLLVAMTAGHSLRRRARPEGAAQANQWRKPRKSRPGTAAARATVARTG